MSRPRKLFAAGIVVAAGILLAWPFRKVPTDETMAERGTGSLSNSPPTHAVPPVAKRSESESAPAGTFHQPGPPLHIAAKMASIGPEGDSEEERSNRILGSIDIADLTAAETGSGSSARPAYRTGLTPGNSQSRDDWPREVAHVVRNGDTLEKLAERYLGDGDRSLEIFDLNRDQLSNPHLLPIGVELRIPGDPRKHLD